MLSNVTKSVQKQVAELHLPKNLTIRPAAQGQQDLMNQALTALLSSLAISIVLVFLLIVALYDSYRTPFVTLFLAIPHRGDRGARRVCGSLATRSTSTRCSA